MADEEHPDPALTVRLLWRRADEPARRGPRRQLDLDTVVAAGTALADAGGVAAVTMRRVAAALGVAAMTLYSYVPDKAVLLQLMLDQALADQPRPDTADRTWRERVAVVAAGHRQLYLRHAWAAELSPARPPPGPGVLAAYDYELAAFDGLGLSDVDRDAALTFVRTFAAGNARDTLAVRAEQRTSARSDAQWWAAVGPVLAEVVDPERFPLAVRVGEAAGEAQGTAYDAEQAYRFGLERVLDGLAAIIEAPPR